MMRFAYLLSIIAFGSPLFAAGPGGKLGRGVAIAFQTTGSGGLQHLGPCVGYQDGILNIAFAVMKKPRGKEEFLYFILYKDPEDRDTGGIEGTAGRSGAWSVDATHKLTVGRQQLEIAYKVELDRATKNVTTESIQVGKFKIGPNDSRIFLADFSVKPFTLQQVPQHGFALNEGTHWDNDLRAPTIRKTSESKADRVFGIVETLKHRSIAVRSFLAAEPTAEPVAFSSGDPRNLSPPEIRAIWDMLVDVEVPRDETSNQDNGLKRKPLTSRTATKNLLKDQYRTNYGSLDLYMAIRQAEIASDLGLRAWSVDFEGGPLNLWWEVENQGNVVVPIETLGVISPQLSIHGLTHAERGRLMFWYLPGINEENPTARGRKILDVMRTMRRFDDGVSHGFAFQVLEGKWLEYGFHNSGSSGPWLWGEWKDTTFARHSEPGPFKVTGVTTLLDVEATEHDPPEGAQPRRVRLKLKAKPAKRR